MASISRKLVVCLSISAAALGNEWNGKLLIMFRNVRVAVGQVLENLRESSERDLKSSENRQNTSFFSETYTVSESSK